MKAYGLALGLALLLSGCATNTSGIALMARRAALPRWSSIKTSMSP